MHRSQCDHREEDVAEMSTSNEAEMTESEKIYGQVSGALRVTPRLESRPHHSEPTQHTQPDLPHKSLKYLYCILRVFFKFL